MDKRTGTKTMSTLSSQGDSKWHTNRVIEKNRYKCMRKCM